MNLLVGVTRPNVVDWDDAFDFDLGVTAGELLEPAGLCERDQFIQWPGGCGCGRSFVGMASDKTTTVAVVADVPITRAELRTIAADRHADDDEPGLIDRLVDDLVENGSLFDVGQVCRIWRFQVEIVSINE